MKPTLFIYQEDWKRVGMNALIFLAPMLVIFFTAIMNGVDIHKAMYLVYMWILNAVVDFLRKLQATQKTS